jgi:hypothetical protein
VPHSLGVRIPSQGRDENERQRERQQRNEQRTARNRCLSCHRKSPFLRRRIGASRTPIPSTSLSDSKPHKPTVFRLRVEPSRLQSAIIESHWMGCEKQAKNVRILSWLSVISQVRSASFVRQRGDGGSTARPGSPASRAAVLEIGRRAVREGRATGGASGPKVARITVSKLQLLFLRPITGNDRRGAPTSFPHPQA